MCVWRCYWVCMCAWQIYAIWARDCTSITVNGVSVLCISARLFGSHAICLNLQSGLGYCRLQNRHAKQFNIHNNGGHWPEYWCEKCRNSVIFIYPLRQKYFKRIAKYITIPSYRKCITADFKNRTTHFGEIYKQARHKRVCWPCCSPR